jgi:MFS family permease
MTDASPDAATSTAGLRGHRAFRFLWTADAASQLGTAAATALVPLLAATTLGATPLQMGLLTAAETVAFLVIGLPAGAWIDRTRRRRAVLVGADLVRALLFFGLPVAGWTGVLDFGQLLVTAVLVGVATVFFDAAYQAYLPVVIGLENLETGYARLQITLSVAAAAGPGIGGLLTRVIGAASGLMLTGAGYLASAALLSRVRADVPPIPPRPGKVRLRTEIAEGLHYIAGHRQLRPLAVASSVAAFFTAGIISMEILFFTHDLHLDAAGAGLLLALSGVGSVIGAATTGRWTRRIGAARANWLVPVLTWPPHLLLPLAQPGPIGLVLAATGIVIHAAGGTTYNVIVMTRRQHLTPDALRGRVHTSMRVLIWGTMPLGALAAGVFAESVGTRATLTIAVAGILVAIVPAAWSARDHPAP